jgi:hypothetical protein
LALHDIPQLTKLKIQKISNADALFLLNIKPHFPGAGKHDQPNPQRFFVKGVSNVIRVGLLLLMIIKYLNIMKWK